MQNSKSAELNYKNNNMLEIQPVEEKGRRRSFNTLFRKLSSTRATDDQKPPANDGSFDDGATERTAMEVVN